MLCCPETSFSSQTTFLGQGFTSFVLQVTNASYVPAINFQAVLEEGVQSILTQVVSVPTVTSSQIVSSVPLAQTT